MTMLRQNDREVKVYAIPFERFFMFVGGHDVCALKQRFR